MLVGICLRRSMAVRVVLLHCRPRAATMFAVETMVSNADQMMIAVVIVILI